MGGPNYIIVSIPVHVTLELKHFIPKVIGRGRWLEDPDSVVLYPLPRLLGRLESVPQYPPPTSKE
jgi:hypothetical protein